MYCSSCGAALSHQMKYCKLCGARLPRAKDKDAAKATEKRLDEYLDGLFWITVFGLGFILGGMALIKEALHLNNGILVAYLVISSTAFLVNFGLSLWQVVRMVRESKEEDETVKPLDTNPLDPVEEPLSLDAAASNTPASLTPASVTEDATRVFEPAPKERISR
jgi:hypothetical protein